MPVVRLTRTSVEKLAFNGKQLEYFDTKLTGFGVRVNSKTKTYFAQGKITLPNGARPKFNESVGRVGILPFDEAEQRAKAILEDAARGVLPAQRKKQREHQASQDSKRDITTQKVRDLYLSARRLKDSTKKEYRELLSHNVPDWLDIPIRNITSSMVLERHAEIGKRSPARADGVMRVVRALCQYVIDTYEDLGIVIRNPARKLSATKAWFRPGRKTTYLRAEDLAAWFSSVMNLDDLARMYFLLLLFSGARHSEVASVRVSDFNFRAGSVRFRETKGGVALEIPISSYIQPRVEAYIYRNDLKDGDFLFPTVGKVPSKSGHIEKLEVQVDRVVAASGVPFTVHDLRRSFLSYCTTLRIPKLVQKRLVGHAIPTDVTDGYIQIPFEDLEQAIEEITAYILKMAKQE